MTLERRIASLFAMDEASWARHANPWSGWTRFTALPLLALAGWSRVWLGWGAVLPVAAALAWIWYNPRLFAPPLQWNAWITRGVLGERIWLDRDIKPVPKRHQRLPNILSAIVAIGLVLTLYGVLALSPWPVLMGIAVATLAKLWFIDRMVWLHGDTKETQR
jgi:hypothetical protein